MRILPAVAVIYLSGLLISCTSASGQPRLDGGPVEERSAMAVTGSREAVAEDRAHAIIGEHLRLSGITGVRASLIKQHSTIARWDSDAHGRFLIVYADVVCEDYPRGIRSASGNNGPNFVFRLKDVDATLVYHNGDGVENRIELVEHDGALYLHSAAHIGLAAGPPGISVYRWDGVSFKSVE